jgi:hypothetical protein
VAAAARLATRIAGIISAAAGFNNALARDGVAGSRSDRRPWASADPILYSCSFISFIVPGWLPQTAPEIGEAQMAADAVKEIEIAQSSPASIRLTNTAPAADCVFERRASGPLEA